MHRYAKCINTKSVLLIIPGVTKYILSQHNNIGIGILYNIGIAT